MMPRRIDNQRGESILSILVGLLLSGIVLSASTSFFIDSLYHSSDVRSFTRAQVAASSLLDLMSFELRMLGSGMPLSQADFSYSDSTIGTLALPLSLSASQSEITFRLNETGTSAVLTSDFIPSSANRTFSVDSPVGFNPGDTVYLSSLSVGGTHGLHGVIDSVDGSTIRLSTFTTTSNARFPASSLAQPVSEVTYTTSSNGVSRTSTRGATMHSSGTTFELTYLDSTGQPLSLPLTATAIRNSLAGINILVRVESRSRFGDRASITQAQQTVALRNLILSR